MSTKSSYSRFAPEMQAAISSITGIDFKDDIDTPPDILELCDKDETQKFINSHPNVKMMKNLKDLQKNQNHLRKQIQNFLVTLIW